MLSKNVQLLYCYFGSKISMKFKNRGSKQRQLKGVIGFMIYDM